MTITKEQLEAMQSEHLQKVRQLEQLKDELRKAIGRMDDMAKEYAAENERLRLQLDIALEALEFYAAENTWSPDNFLVGSEKLRSDLSETKWSKFTPGARAREALAKIRGEG